MVKYCCVPLCGRFGGHKFPTDENLRMKWRVAIKRIDPKTKKLWNPGKDDIVCHYHFTEANYKMTELGEQQILLRPKPTSPQELGERCRLKPGAVPSTFDFKRDKPDSDRSKCMKRRHPTQNEPANFQHILHHIDDEMSIQEEVVIGQAEAPSENDEVEVGHSKMRLTDREVQCEIPVIGKFAIEGLRYNSKMVSYYTGFNSYDHFMLLFNILGPAAFDLKYNCSLLSPQDQLFLTLMKLRQAKEDIELSMLFQVSESTVSKIVTTWINFLYFQLKELEQQFWPPMETIQQHMPTDFAKKFGNTRVILDATEQPIQKPSDVEAQSKSWSSYKHKNTVKTMVGVTPNGAVSFISSAYGGHASDRQIIERSSLLDQGKFRNGDSIMADRGIMVQDLFANQNVYVNTPTLLKGKSQLDPDEVVRDRRVASKRIHVEREIGLTKRFKILKHDLPASKVPLASRIVYICFAISNFRNCIVDNNA